MLAVGLEVIGVGPVRDRALAMQERIAAEAARAVAGSVHGVQTEVSGRDIHVAGLADSEAERQALRAALDAVPGRRVLRGRLEILAPAAPYDTWIAKAESGALTASGHVPSERARAELAPVLGDAASALELASGAPAGHLALVAAGIAALGPMIEGEARIGDGKLELRGEVLGPEQRDAVLAALPPGVAPELVLRDDGTPPDWRLDYTAAAGAVLRGKLPRGFDAMALARETGLPKIGSEAVQALLGPEAGQLPGVFATLRPWLAELETLEVAVAPDGLTVRMGFGAGRDPLALEQRLGPLCGPDVTLEVGLVRAEADEGATRINAAGRVLERLSRGYWLPAPDFPATPADCRVQAMLALRDDAVAFVPGSDRLDAEAPRGLNRLAAVLIPCTRAGIGAEIGAHVDASGQPLEDLALSQRQAEAVRAALVARGVAAAMLRPRGYGALQPVADTATAGGRAMNRRVTVLWSR